MPKIDAEGRPTSAGMTGHVVNAASEIHEVDPSRNVDGTVADGYESDERELSDDENYQSPGVGEPPAPTENNPAYREERDSDPEHPDDNNGNTEDQAAEKREQGKGEQADRPAASKESAGVTSGTPSKAGKEAGPSRGNSSSASPAKMSSTPAKK